MSRGRPFERGNTYGKGRPKGSRNKKILGGHEIFEQNSAAIMALAINSSREDRQMLRMLASRVAPRQREAPVKIGRLTMSTLSDLDRASEVAINKGTSGRINLGEAREITDMIEIRRRILVAEDLDRRLSLLENGRGMSGADGSNPPKRFVGTMEELLALFRQLTVGAEENNGKADDPAA